MTLHTGCRTIPVAGADRFEHRLVLVQAGEQSSRVQTDGSRQYPSEVVTLVLDRAQHLIVAGEGCQRAVKLCVLFDIRESVAALDGLALIGDPGVERPQPGGRHAPGKLANDPCLQSLPQAEVVAELLVRDPTHPHSALRNDFDEALTREALESDPDRRLAHAQLGRESSLAQLGSGRNRATDDRLAQSREGLLLQRLPVLDGKVSFGHRVSEGTRHAGAGYKLDTTDRRRQTEISVTVVTANVEIPAELDDWLHDVGLLDVSERLPPCRPLPGGVSSRTVVVEPDGRQAIVVKQALRKLRVESDWFADPERIHVEADGIRWLTRICGPGCVPRLMAEDREHHIVAMEYVRAASPSWKAMLLAGQLDAGVARSLGQLLARLHVGSAEELASARETFADRTNFETLRVEPFYQQVAATVPEARVALERLVDDLRERHIALVHGDFSPKNVLVLPNRVVLLDHEVMHVGDPAFDLGFFLAHLLSKANADSARRLGLLMLAEEFWATYSAQAARAAWFPGVAERAVDHTLGCVLARVAGRSPVEYLDARQRVVQRKAALALMAQRPSTIPELLSALVARFS